MCSVFFFFTCMKHDYEIDSGNGVLFQEVELFHGIGIKKITGITVSRQPYDQRIHSMLMHD